MATETGLLVSWRTSGAYQWSASQAHTSEVVTQNSLEEKQGVGTALLSAVKAHADQKGVRLWLITTDDNGNAIRFYENRGMTRAALHRDFIEVVRTYKPHVNGGAGANSYSDAIEFTY